MFLVPTSSGPSPARPPARLIALLAALVLVLAACSRRRASRRRRPSARSAASHAGSADRGAAPTPSPTRRRPSRRPLTDDEGTAVTLPAEPAEDRLADARPRPRSCSPSAPATGSSRPTTAATSRAEAAAFPDVATFSSVDTEKIVGLGADLVIAGGLGFTPPDAITKLRSLGIPVLVVYAPSVDGVLKDIELIGARRRRADEATAITDRMHAEIEAISDAAAAEAAKAGSKARVFYEIGYTDATGEIFAPADKSFLAEMVDARRRRRRSRPATRTSYADPAREARSSAIRR